MTPLQIALARIRELEAQVAALPAKRDKRTRRPLIPLVRFRTFNPQTSGANNGKHPRKVAHV